jgi:hypothetical protein
MAHREKKAAFALGFLRTPVYAFVRMVISRQDALFCVRFLRIFFDSPQPLLLCRAGQATHVTVDHFW